MIVAPRARSSAGRRGRTAGVLLAGATAVACLVGPVPSASSAVTAPVWPVVVTNVSVHTVNVIGKTGTTTLSVGASPSGVAITPDGRYAYVVDRGANALSIIDGPGTATPTVSPTMVHVGTKPVSIAITPDGKYAYVPNAFDNTVTVVAGVDTPAPSVLATLHVGSQPIGVAITPDGQYAYVANAGADSLSVIDNADSATPSVSPVALTVGTNPALPVITPDGHYLYVATTALDRIAVVDNADSASPSVSTTTLPVGSGPIGIAITPDGTYAYVANGVSNDVSVLDNVDSPSPSVSATRLAMGKGNPDRVAISPDGQVVYVGKSLSTSLRLITGADSAAPVVSKSVITVGKGPLGIAVVPDQAPVAAFTVKTATHGSATAFNASTSTVAFGTITSYAWSFGDGQVTTGTTPHISHVFGAAGTYPVTVTETDSAGTSTTLAFTGQTVSRNGGPSATITHSVTIR